MVSTTRMGMELVDGTDTIGGVNPSLQAKVNDALQKLDQAGGRVLCTSAARPTTNLFAGLEAYETDTRRTIMNVTGTVGDWRIISEDVVSSLGSGRVRAVRPVRPYGGDTGHSAFPCPVVLRNGTCLMVYRQGTDHVTSRDGVIKKATSTDQGRTWTAATTIATGAAGIDLRDPCVSLSRDGTKIYLTYFKGSAASNALGVFFRYSTDGGTTWTAEVRVDNQTYAASSAPVVELDTGTLVIPWYGKASGDTRDSVWTAKSTDGGANWTNTRIINGQTAGVDFQEPWISMKGQTGVMAYRYGTNTGISTSTTADNTANWSGAVNRFEGTGRPTIWWANETTVAVIYRRLIRLDAVVRISRNGGTIFEPERLLDKAWNVGSLGMTYAGVDKLSNGSTIVVFGQESASTVSRIFITYMAEAGAMTPLGAVPQENEAVVNNYDNVTFATQFDQPNGSLVYPWFIIGGAAQVTEGELLSSVADNVPDYPAVYVNHTDMEVEADIACVGTLAGAGVVFRMIDANNFCYVTVESGTTAKTYRVDGGVHTTFGSTIDLSTGFPFNAYNTWKVVVRNNSVRFFFNGASALANALPTGDFQTGRWAGLKLNSQASVTTKCRRFVVKS